MQIIILAAGKGSRMKSSKPKVMHELSGKPMISHVIENCQEITDNLILVYSDHLEPFLSQIGSSCQLVKQDEQLGTAHAVSVAQNLFANDDIAVIYGDNPLISSEIIGSLVDHMRRGKYAAVTLAFDYDKPNQYGRIVCDQDGNFQRIVEAKFANEEEKKITLCNSGVMAFAPGVLDKYISKCLERDATNLSRELYLTDIIDICRSFGERVSYYKSPDDHQLVVGVNTQEELHDANLLIKKQHV